MDTREVLEQEIRHSEIYRCRSLTIDCRHCKSLFHQCVLGIICNRDLLAAECLICLHIGFKLYGDGLPYRNLTSRIIYEHVGTSITPVASLRRCECYLLRIFTKVVRIQLQINDTGIIDQFPDLQHDRGRMSWKTVLSLQINRIEESDLVISQGLDDLQRLPRLKLYRSHGKACILI